MWKKLTIDAWAFVRVTGLSSASVLMFLRDLGQVSWYNGCNREI